MLLKKAVLTGLITAILMYGVVESFGYNYYTWTLQLYAYVALAVIVALQASKGSEGLFNRFQDRLLYVTDMEDKKIRKVLTGEEFKVTGTKKVQ